MQARSLLVVLVCVGISACVPRLYQRETLAIDHREMDRFDIRYDEFEGCLLKRPVPVAYTLRRESYTLDVDVHFGENNRAPSLDVVLTDGHNLSARFPDLQAPPPATVEGSDARYRIGADLIRFPSFQVEVLSDGRVAGEEIIQVRREHCRALALDRDASSAP